MFFNPFSEKSAKQFAEIQKKNRMRPSRPPSGPLNKMKNGYAHKCGILMTLRAYPSSGPLSGITILLQNRLDAMYS